MLIPQNSRTNETMCIAHACNEQEHMKLINFHELKSGGLGFLL